MAAFIDAAGATQQLEVTLDMIKAAKDNAQSLRDFVNAQYPTNAEAYGDTFSQLCASEGIRLMSQKKHGMKATSLDAVLNGATRIEASAVVREPSNQARVLLMPAVGALVEDRLVGDLEASVNAFQSMLALDDTIADDWLLWPEANFTNASGARSQVVSQLAKPASMLTLTTSEKQVRVPTYGLGIEWSEQATKYLNLDFIALSIARQIAVERNERADADLLAMLNGDADVGQTALSAISGKVVKVDVYDPAVTGTGELSQKAWVKWLYTNGNKRRITHVITDIDGALAIQARSGRPVIVGDNNNSPRINTNETVMNPAWSDEVEVYITSNANWPANTILGIDKNYAIQRVTSVNASYSAQQEFVVTRSSIMRFDYGSISRRLYTDAFEVLSLTQT